MEADRSVMTPPAKVSFLWLTLDVQRQQEHTYPHTHRHGSSTIRVFSDNLTVDEQGSLETTKTKHVTSANPSSARTRLPPSLSSRRLSRN